MIIALKCVYHLFSSEIKGKLNVGVQGLIDIFVMGMIIL